jgi:hypothetical protein
MHFTPTYASWLNPIGLWLGKIERDVIACGVFTSASDRKRKPMRHIRHYNRHPKTVKWKSFDPPRRITPESLVAAHKCHRVLLLGSVPLHMVSFPGSQPEPRRELQQRGSGKERPDDCQGHEGQQNRRTAEVLGPFRQPMGIESDAVDRRFNA